MTTIAEVLKYPKGTPVQGLTARVVRAYKPRTGEGQYGSWSVMDLDLEDGSGQMKACWWYNMVDDPSHITGKSVTINATEDPKGKLRGAEVEHHEYKGQTTIRIKINGDRLQFASAAAPANGGAPHTGATSPVRPPATGLHGEKLTLDAYLAVAGRAYRYAVDVLGVSDYQAAIAFANTAGIAASQGRLVVEVTDEPEPPEAYA